MRFFLAVVAVAGITLPSLINGHGYMTVPSSRNSKLGWTPSASNGHGVCGGFATDWDSSGFSETVNSPIQSDLTTLYAGGKMTVKMTITAAHKGHVVMEVCRPTPGMTNIEDSCFKRLYRDPSDTKWSPYVAKHPDYFFFPENECTQGTHVTGTWLIPADFGDCEHCIVRWYWQTGNSCRTHRVSQSEFGSWISPNGCPVAFSNPSMGECMTGANYNCPEKRCSGEHFKSCGDVKIIGSGTTPTTPPADTTTKPTSTSVTDSTASSTPTPTPIVPTTPVPTPTGTPSKPTCGSDNPSFRPCNGPSNKCLSIFPGYDCTAFCQLCCHLDRAYKFEYCN